MRQTVISVPIIGYKDFALQFFYGDEEEEERAAKRFNKEFPQKSKEEGYAKIK